MDVKTIPLDERGGLAMGYVVKYETFGTIYESDHEFMTHEDAEAWTRYLLSFGYVSRAWIE